MNTLLISPHDDDHALFTAYTCMREKPLVAVVTDSFRQPMRGEVGCDAQTRMLETLKSCEVLGCPVFRMGIPDTYFDADPKVGDLLERVFRCFQNYDKVYAPALQFGNKDHDLISEVAKRVFGDKVIFYTTYTKNALYTEGTKEIVPTEEEKELKEKALACYTSQLNLPATKPHFDAVVGKSEWLI